MQKETGLSMFRAFAVIARHHPLKKRVSGGDGCFRTLSVRFRAFAVIARNHRCRGNLTGRCGLTTLLSDSHAHVRSLGMTCCRPLIPVLSRGRAQNRMESGLRGCPRPKTRLLAGPRNDGKSANEDREFLVLFAEKSTGEIEFEN